MLLSFMLNTLTTKVHEKSDDWLNFHSDKVSVILIIVCRLHVTNLAVKNTITNVVILITSPAYFISIYCLFLYLLFVK